MGKLLNKEIAENSLEAIPAMVVANVAIDVGKDFYKCFVLQSIDTDDVLCNSVNNMYTSFAGYGGAWVGAQVAGYVTTGVLASAQTACATGAAIGSVLGPIGTIVGSVVGGLVIGIGANAVVGKAEKDAIEAYNKTIKEINTHIELSGCEKMYYFALNAQTGEIVGELPLSSKRLAGLFAGVAAIISLLVLIGGLLL